ncbi:ABC transporter permease [Rothia sp. P13129]|uniref:ABC transporter permease n=1 Tax=Rothia sp. P13129 TaxID=3402664 RepID=UPI003AC2E199
MNKSVAPWRIVMVREISTKLRDKTFIISTLFSVVIIVLSMGLNIWLGQKNSHYTVAVTSQKAQQLVESSTKVIQDQDPDGSLTAQLFDSEQLAQHAVEDDDVDAYLKELSSEQGWELVYKDSAQNTLTRVLEDTVFTQQIEQNAAQAGISWQELQQGTSLKVSMLKESDNHGIALLVGVIFAMVFYMSSLIFGQLIAMSVVEEKQNRIVEIIATAIPISQLLAGKVLGNVILAVGQMLLYGVVALTGLNIFGIAQEYAWILPSAGWFAVFYVVGFAAVATIWAAVGAMSSRVEDIGSLASPLTIILMAAFFAGIYSSGVILTVVSYLPIASSIAMPMRMLREDVFFWEPILSLVFALVATWGMTLWGAKIYRHQVMRSGSAATWKQVLLKKEQK